MIQDNKSRILEQAIQVLSHHFQSTMEQIAEKLRISRATLYRHFKTKELLLKEITLYSFDVFKSIAEPILQSDLKADEKLNKFVGEFVPIGSRFYFLTYNDMFLKDVEIGNLYKKQNKYFESFAIALKKEDFIDQSLPEEWFAAALEFIIYGAWEKIYQGDIAVNKAPELVLKTLLYGLGKK